MKLFGFTIERRNKTQPKDFYFPLYSFGSHNLYPISIQNPTVSSAMNLMAGAIAKLPTILYFKKNDNSRIRASFHPLYTLLKHAPNTEEPVFTFKFRIIMYLFKNGNAYIYREINKGQAIGLHLLNPVYVTVRRDDDGNKIFQYNGKTYTSDEVLHIPALNYDGLIGHSPLEAGQYAVELGNTLDEYAKNSIGNGFNTGMLIDPTEYLTGLDDDKVTAELNNIGRYYANHGTGPQNTGKPLVLLPKTKGIPVDLSSNRDAQLTESRELQIKEIAKLFNLPLPLLTGTGEGDLENTNMLFLSYSLSPWIKLIDSYLDQLLTPYESERYYFETSTDPILTVSMVDKFTAYRCAIEAGIFSENEIRAKENQPALDESYAGNVHFFPANLVPLTDENVKAYFAKSKLALQNAHNNAGDDKS